MYKWENIYFHYHIHFFFKQKSKLTAVTKWLQEKYETYCLCEWVWLLKMRGGTCKEGRCQREGGTRLERLRKRLVGRHWRRDFGRGNSGWRRREGLAGSDGIEVRVSKGGRKSRGKLIRQAWLEGVPECNFFFNLPFCL